MRSLGLKSAVAFLAEDGNASREEVEDGDRKQVQVGKDGGKHDQDGDKQWGRASFKILLPFFL